MVCKISFYADWVSFLKQVQSLRSFSGESGWLFNLEEIYPMERKKQTVPETKPPFLFRFQLKDCRYKY